MDKTRGTSVSEINLIPLNSRKLDWYGHYEYGNFRVNYETIGNVPDIELSGKQIETGQILERGKGWYP